MAEQKAFEETFNVRIPADDKINFATIRDLIVGMGNSSKQDSNRLFDSVDNIKREMTSFKGEFKEVRAKVDSTADTVEALKKRIEILESFDKMSQASPWSNSAMCPSGSESRNRFL